MLNKTLLSPAMHKYTAFFIALLLSTVCTTIPSNGGVISLETVPSAHFSKEQAVINVFITNFGNEPARSVKVSATVSGISAQAGEKDFILPGASHQATITLPRLPQPNGIHTVVITTTYTDGNQAFNAMSSIPLITADMDTYSDTISASLTSTAFYNKGEIELTLQSHSKENLPIQVSLPLPPELKCKQPEKNLNLPPGTPVTLKFSIVNISASLNSTYPVFAVINYTENNLHCSITSQGTISIEKHALLAPSGLQPWLPFAIAYILILCLSAAAWLCKSKQPGPGTNLLPAVQRMFSPALLILLTFFVLCHFPLREIFSNTLTVGGDTPAHNYLASHMKQQLFEKGRIVSWAGGWWCGFPMFQYYFPLPYLLTAVLSLIIPFNIAFKIISILGMVLLPVSAFIYGRLMKMDKPGPLLLALAMIPLLFDYSHTMWGVNIYSTLAGMISNSISFPIMLIFIGCASRDADDGKFRLTTVFLFSALIASHFFTSIMAGMIVTFIPFLKPKSGILKAIRVIAAELCMTLLIMAWWLIPLLAKKEYSIDFGENWKVVIKEHLPPLWISLTLLPAVLIALVSVFLRPAKFILVSIWMLACSVFLFTFGFDISPVFVNVRLWPFVFYSLLSLCAAGTAVIAGKLKAANFITALITGLVLFCVIRTPLPVRPWAEWNYSGLEKKPHFEVFQKLVLPLKGTPGRLANDLHDDNNLLGSSRIFECVPHLTGKPILEGGIVNSAAGSLFSYYIQSETSMACAGFPPIVKPSHFDFTTATKHLKLFNVKHFIARWIGTRRALAASKDWRLIEKCRDWELYELTTHDGKYVFIPDNYPVAARADNWKETGLKWMYNTNLIDQPLVILSQHEPAPANSGTILSSSQLDAVLTNKTNIACKPVAASSTFTGNIISQEEVSDSSIKFTTQGIGLPHIIKCSYFPNWKVRGASRVYMVTPCFMLVYPEQPEVELYYGSILPDNIGWILSAIGAFSAIMIVILAKKQRTGTKPDGDCK